VNLHHFVLDGAIWKLRDGRVARILIRREAEDADAQESVPATGAFGRRLVWAIGAVCAGVMFVYTWEGYFGLRQALPRGDLERVGVALQRLSWLGRDNPQARAAYGTQWLRGGDPERAAAEFRRALELQETPQLWKALASAYGRQERWAEAAAAYEAGYALPPRDPQLLHEAAVAWLEAGDAERARAAAERVLAADPGRESTRQLLASLGP
jgi:tetratricopeptide (TPR) repeat protein